MESMQDRIKDFEEKEKVWKQNKEQKGGTEKITQLQFIVDKMMSEKSEEQKKLIDMEVMITKLYSENLGLKDEKSYL